MSYSKLHKTNTVSLVFKLNIKKILKFIRSAHHTETIYKYLKHILQGTNYRCIRNKFY